MVCGAANNQLAHAGIDKTLADKGVLYAPDYVVNAGGLIQVADELVVCIVPATGRLDLKAVGKRAAMADPARAEKVTGYVTGGISPLGQRKRLRTYVDASACALDEVVVNGGRRGLQIALRPADLVAVTAATVLELQS